MKTFRNTNKTTAGPFPLIMMNARTMDVSNLSQIPYDPKTQMSIYGGDTAKMMGSKDKSTCSVSSSTREGIFDFGSSDNDRQVDD